MSLAELAYTPRDGWVAIGPAVHPRDAARGRAGALDAGMLVRHEATGRYMLDVGGTLRAVPQAWAAATAAAVHAPVTERGAKVARTYRLAPDVVATIEQRAAEQGVSQTAVVEAAIRAAPE